MGRALSIAWGRSAGRSRHPGAGRASDELLPRSAQPARAAAGDGPRAQARRAELRSKIRDSRYLERAIRCLAQIFIDDATRASRE